MLAWVNTPIGGLFALAAIVWIVVTIAIIATHYSDRRPARAPRHARRRNRSRPVEHQQAVQPEYAAPDATTPVPIVKITRSMRYTDPNSDLRKLL